MMNHPPAPAPAPAPPTTSHNRQRFEQSLQITSRRREELQNLKARLTQRIDGSTASGIPTNAAYNAGTGTTRTVLSSAPPARNIAPYRPVMSVHRNPVSSGFSGVTVNAPPTHPPPAAPPIHSAVNQFRNAVPSSSSLSSSAILGGSSSGGSPSRIPKYTDTRGSVGVTSTVNAMAPPTPQTIRRAEEALSGEKPVDSKKGMIYLMNTYDGMEDDVSAVGENTHSDSGLRCSPSKAGLKNVPLTSVASKIPSFESSIKGTSVLNEMSGSPIQQRNVDINEAVNTSSTITTKKTSPLKSNIPAPLVRYETSETGAQLTLLKMVQKEQALKEKALKQAISANSRKNYRMFALLVTKVIKRKYEIAKIKSFIKIRDNKYSHRITPMSLSPFMSEVPKFEENVREHTTKLAKYTVRTIEMERMYAVEESAEKYRSKFDTSDSNTVSIRAFLKTDHSRALLIGGSFYHSTNGLTWNSNIHGKIGFIDNFGSEEEYDLNQVFSEMIGVRDAYIKSVKTVDHTTKSTTNNNENTKSTQVYQAGPNECQPSLPLRSNQNGDINMFRYKRKVGEVENIDDQGSIVNNSQADKSNVSKPSEVIPKINPNPAWTTGIPTETHETNVQTSVKPQTTRHDVKETNMPPILRHDVKDINVPPTITRINANENLNDPVENGAQLPELDIKGINASQSDETTDRAKKSFHPDAPVLLKQPKVSVEYLPITPPTNPIAYLLLLPSRITFYIIRKIIWNMLYLSIVLSLWFYFMDDTPLVSWGLNVPSGVIGVPNLRSALLDIMEEIPDDWKLGLYQVLESIQNTIG